MKIQEKGADYLVRSQAAEWQRGTLGELLPIKYGKSLPEKLRDTTGSHPVFGSSGRVGIHSAALTVGPTLIIGRKGNVGAIHYSSEACWPIDTVYYVEPPDGQKLRYYKYLLESLNLVKLDKSTAVPGLSRDDYNAVEVVVAPPDQQDGIVAEIEKQFSRLDEAVSNLKSVKANLKRYKAAVLTAAVEGRLVETEAELARREGRSFETGGQLLQRILETRRSRWKGKGKYKEPAAPDTSDLPELPEGWVWASVNQIAEKVVDGTHHTPEYVTAGVPFISVKDVRDGMIHFDDTKYITSSVHDELIKRCRPEMNDVLITKSGTIGRTTVISTDKPFSLFVSVALIKPVKPVVNSKFLKISLDAYIQSIDIAQDIKGGLLKNLHLEDLRVVAIPLPPKSEQHRIVAEVDRRLSIIKGIECQVDANYQRVERLRQSVLGKAFSGKRYAR